MAFTVESLSPHWVLDPSSERPATEHDANVEGATGYIAMIVDNLRKAGIQNTIKGERLVFDRLRRHVSLAV